MSVFTQEKSVSIAVGASVSDQFAVGDFSRGSFVATAAVTGDINFEVSNDNGATWDTLTDAAGTFNNIATPAVNKPRALPASLFQFRHARIKTSANQATAPGVVKLLLVIA